MEPAAYVPRPADRSPDPVGPVRGPGAPRGVPPDLGARLLAGLERGSVATAVVRGRDHVVDWANAAFAALLPVCAGMSVDALGVPGLAARVDEVVATGTPVRDAGRVSTADRDLERVAALSLSRYPGSATGRATS